MKVDVGQVLESRVDATRIVVTREPSDEVEISCGGVAMVPAGDAAGLAPVPATGGPLGPGLKVGKRYHEPVSGLEVLCVRAGECGVDIDGAAVAQAESKSLPASD